MAEEKKDLWIALVGSAPSSARAAPYNDPRWQIWGCSPGLYGVAPRVNAWFELHVYEPGQPWFSPEYVQWLNALPGRGVTLWMGAPEPDAVEYKAAPITGAQVVPHHEINAEFDPSCWFNTSSLFWMTAIAIKAGATKIGYWGVDMAATEEYEMQRAGIHFLAYEAMRRGIEVGTPKESDLFTPRFRYGIDEWTHSFAKNRAREAELKTRLNQATAEMNAKQGEVAFLNGAIDDHKYMRDTWVMANNFTGPRPFVIVETTSGNT